MSVVRRTKQFARDFVARAIAPVLRRLAFDPRYFDLWQTQGFHVSQVHYYQPIPDTREIDPSVWQRHSRIRGLDIRAEQQKELLSIFTARFKHEYNHFPRGRQSRDFRFYLGNVAFEAVDAEILFCMIRYFKPKTIFEIGSGWSTLLAADALSRNLRDGSPGKLIAIEPYPPEFLSASIPEEVELLRRPVQKVALTQFEALRENDILFIDSSHVCTIGSDVHYEVLEILPQLNPGVLIHIHDIFLPAEYPKEWVLDRHHFWNEQYIVQAFLCFNDTFEILWAGQWMHLTHPEVLLEAFKSYHSGVSPASLWLRRTH
jgi:predicted O-methyltransferase YrrM